MSSRSDQVFQNLKSAEQKFEYFILGVAVALFAYIGEKNTPQPISFSQNSFELLALVLLVVSIFSGFKRIEKNITSQTVNYSKLEASNKLGSYKKALMSAELQIESSGEIFNPQKAVNKIKFLEEKAIPRYMELMKEINGQSVLLYKVRNWSLLLSFISLIIAKVVGGYLK